MAGSGLEEQVALGQAKEKEVFGDLYVFLTIGDDFFDLSLL